MREARRAGVSIVPVDSEHSAIWQCLRGERTAEVKRLLLTASGGPFRRAPLEQLRAVTVEQALAHPTWHMGPKITIDSATLMNKGLEVIEARWLFGFDADQITVVVHPQSVVHSMVEMIDGSIIAQLGGTDMRHAIQYALTYPTRFRLAVATSPAIFHSYADARRVNPGAYDSAAQWAATDVTARAAEFAGLPVRIAIGSGDPFVPAVRALRDRLPDPGIVEISTGCHDNVFWSYAAPAQVRAISAALAR